MKTPLETRGSRANDGRSARLGKKQPDGTHAHRIAHARRRAAPDAGPRWTPGRAGRRAAPDAGPRWTPGLVARARLSFSLASLRWPAGGVNQRARTRGISHSGRSGKPEVPSGWSFTPST